MNIFAVSGLLTAITSGLMAILMCLKGKQRLHYLWGFFCFSVMLWGFGGYKIATTTDPVQAVFWWKIAYVGVIFIPILFTHFVQKLLNIVKPWFIGTIYLVTLFFLASNLFTHLFIDKVRWVFNQFYYISPPAPLYTPFFILFIVLVVYSHIKLLQAYKNASGTVKAQIKYLFVATALGFGGGSFSYLPVYRIDLYPFLNLAIVPFPLIVVYAILKYRLMDIRIVFRKIFLYFGAAIFVYGIFYLIIWIDQRAFGGFYTNEAYFVGILFALGFVILFQMFNGWIVKFANKYLFFSLYNYQETINRLSDELTHYNDLNKIIDTIVDTIKKTMGLNRAGVLLINNQVKPVHFQIARVIGFNEQNGISLVQDNFLTKHLEKTQKPLVSDELMIFSRDANTVRGRQSFARLYELMNHIEASLCLPLMGNKKLIGIIVLGSKVSGDAYTEEDLELLNTLSKQAGIAVDNARLYKEAQEFSKTLQGKVNEQTKDITEKNKDITQKNQYLQELLNMKTDFLRVVNHQLNTPLSVLRNSFSMVEEGIFPPKRGFEYAKAGLERMSETIQDFWDAFELEGEKMKMHFNKVNIEEIVNGLIEEKKKLQLAKERNIEVSATKPKFKVPLVWCDGKKTTHVISNLLDNAVFYTQKGSVTLNYELLDSKLKINVVDTGVGISEENKKRLFIKFSRGSGSTNLHPDGSGLGLYIAKKIVEASEGEMTYSSDGEGKGSTFSLTIPLYTNQKPIEETNIERGKGVTMLDENNLKAKTYAKN